MSKSQVEDFLSKAEPLVNPPEAEPASPNQPKVPFQSNLRLTAEQEKRLLDHAFTRYKTLSSELGRDQTLSPIWYTAATAMSNPVLGAQGLMPAGDTFLGKRSRFDATFLNDVSYRPFTMPSPNIFQDSNIAVPLVRRICRQMIARAKNAFFGAEPWFSVGPAPVPEYDPVNDAERATAIQHFTRFKLKENRSKEDKERAISRALIIGECAVYTSYVVRDQMFNIEARVLTGVDGNPIRAADGDFITESDEFADVEDGTGTRVLKRDGLTVEPEAPIWQQIPLDRRQVLFEGSKSEPVYYKDFMCPLTATDVQTADCVIRVYDKPVMEFVDLVVKRGMVADTTDGRMGAAQKMVASVRVLSSNSPAPKAAVNQDVRPNENYTTGPSVETGGPIAEFAEFYLWFDANEDGVAENIFLIADRNTRQPIFYDHVANVSIDGLRPIEIVRINPVEGRWYGQGIIEMFEPYQTMTDLLVNRWNFSQSRSGRIDLFRASDTIEGDANQDLRINWGGRYTPKPGVDVSKILFSHYLTDIKFDQVHLMIQFFMQLAMNESGVTNANDDQAAGMQSAKLATGINQVVQSGDELFKPIIADLKGPLERILNREIDVTLANMNPEEVYTYLEGNTQQIEVMTPEEVRGLRFKTEITLTTQRDHERIQLAAQVIAIIKDFYSLLPLVQTYVAAEYRKQLRALDPTIDVDSVIVPLPLGMGATMEPGAGQPSSEGGMTVMEGGAKDTEFSTQLGQKDTQQKGVSAPGGTPKAG